MNYKIKTFNEWIQHEYGQSLNEKLDSSILRSIEKDLKSSSLFNLHKIIKLLDDKLKWNKIKDTDFIEVEDINNLDLNDYEDGLFFWVSGNRFIDLSTDKKIIDIRPARIGFYKFPKLSSSETIKRDVTKVYILPAEVLDKYSAGELLTKRYNDKVDAIALKQDEEIRKENIERYNRIITSKVLQKTDIQEQLEELMELNKNFLVSFDKLSVKDAKTLNKELGVILEKLEEIFKNKDVDKLKGLEEEVNQLYKKYI